MKQFTVGVSWVVLLILVVKIESSIMAIWQTSLIFLAITYMSKSSQSTNLLLLFFLIFIIIVIFTKIELPIALILMSSPVFFATLKMEKYPNFTIASLAVFLLFTIAFLLEKNQRSTSAVIFVFLPIYSTIFGVIVQSLATFFKKQLDDDG